MTSKEIYLHANNITGGTLRDLIDDVNRLSDDERNLINNIFCGYFHYGVSVTGNNRSITIEDALMLINIAYVAGREANNPESDYAG